MYRVRRNQDGKLDSAVANSLKGSGSSSLRGAAKLGALLVALVGSAGLLCASIESPGWIAAVTLLPLLFAIRTFAPLMALASGFVWGASLFAFLTLTGKNPTASLWLSAVLLAGVPALYAFGGALFTRRFGFSALILGFGWAGVELALSPLGFKGGLLVGTLGVSAGGSVGVLYSVLGFVCLASFIAAVNGLLLSLLSRAYVRVRGSMGRFASVSSGAATRLLPREVPLESALYVNPAHARAPPA